MPLTDMSKNGDLYLQSGRECLDSQALVEQKEFD